MIAAPTFPSVRSTAAALYTVGGMATLGISDNLVPLFAETGSLAQFHALRSAMVMVFLVGLALFGVARLRPRRWGAVIGRSLFQGTAMLIYFGCLAVMPIGVVVAGLFTSPIWVLLIGVVFQRRNVGPFRWGAVALGTLGTYLVMGLDPALLAWGAYLALPLVAGLLYAVGAVATRAWCEGEGTLALSAGFFVTLGLFGGIGLTVLPLLDLAAPEGARGFILRGWTDFSPALWGWMAVQAVGALLGIFLLFRGYQVGDATHVAIFEYSLLIFATFWAWVFWSQTVPPLSLVGMALIAAAGGIIAWRGNR